MRKTDRVVKGEIESFGDPSLARITNPTFWKPFRTFGSMETWGWSRLSLYLWASLPLESSRVWEDAGVGLHLQEMYFLWGALEFSMSFESTQGEPSMFTLLNVPPPTSFPWFYHFAVVTVHESTCRYVGSVHFILFCQPCIWSFNKCPITWGMCLLVSLDLQRLYLDQVLCGKEKEKQTSSCNVSLLEIV